jgi:FkbM family methyltransferase
VIGRLKNRLRAAVCALVSLPLRFSSGSVCADVIDNLSSTMTREIAVGEKRVKFFAPTPLLMARADALLAKEPDTIRWLNTIKSGSVFWDVGANVGVFSLYAAIVRDLCVLAFEPAASNFYVLSRNIQINSVASRVSAFCMAFSDRSQLGVLNLPSPEMGSALSQFGTAGEKSRYLNHSISATAQGTIGFSIDEFIERLHPPFPNCLKIDVDGLEWPILRGAANTLRDPRLHSAIIELSLTNEAERNEAIDFLRECGLHFVSHGEVQAAAKEKAANHLFERRS